MDSKFLSVVSWVVLATIGWTLGGVIEKSIAQPSKTLTERVDVLEQKVHHLSNIVKLLNESKKDK